MITTTLPPPRKGHYCVVSVSAPPAPGHFVETDNRQPSPYLITIYCIVSGVKSMPSSRTVLIPVFLLFALLPFENSYARGFLFRVQFCAVLINEREEMVPSRTFVSLYCMFELQIFFGNENGGAPRIIPSLSLSLSLSLSRGAFPFLACCCCCCCCCLDWAFSKKWLACGTPGWHGVSILFLFWLTRGKFVAPTCRSKL